MVGTEIRINGQLVAYLYIHNTGVTSRTTDETLYEWTYHVLNSEYSYSITGTVSHWRDDGLSLLLEKTLNVVNKKKKTLDKKKK